MIQLHLSINLWVLLGLWVLLVFFFSLLNDLGFDKTIQKRITMKTMNVAIRSSNFIFCHVFERCIIVSSFIYSMRSLEKLLLLLLLVHRKENVIVIELTCGFITKIEENSERKQLSYQETLQDLNTRYTKVTFINLSMSALGLIGKNDFGKSIFTALTSIGMPKVTATMYLNQPSIAVFDQHTIFSVRRTKAG